MKSSSLTMVTLKSCEEINNLQSDWVNLFTEISDALVFQSWQWCYSWIENFFSPEIHQLKVILGFHQSKLVIIIPLVGKKNSYKKWEYSIIGYEFADYSDVLIHPGYKYLFPNFFTKAILQNKINELFLRFIPDWSSLQQAIRVLEKKSFFTIRTDREFENQIFSYIILPKDWELYAERLSGKTRRNIKVSIKKLEEENIFPKFTILESDEDIKKILKIHCENLQTNQQIESVYQNPENQRFFINTLQRLYNINVVNLFTLQKEDKIIHFSIQFKSEKRWIGYMTGMDKDYAHISPGRLAMYYIIREMIDQRIEVFDLGWGDESYKSHWAAEISYPVSVHISREGILRKLVVCHRQKNSFENSSKRTE